MGSGGSLFSLPFTCECRQIVSSAVSLTRFAASDMRPRFGLIVNRGQSTVAVAQSFRATVRWHANVTVAAVMIMILMGARRHFHISSHEASVGGAWH